LPRGIRERHSRTCKRATTGTCTCTPSFQVRVWSNTEQAFRVRTFPARGAAEAFQQATKTAIRGGVLVAKKKPVRVAGQELLDGIESGRIRNKRRVPFKPSVHRAYAQGLERTYPHIGDLDVRDVHRRDLQRMVTQLEADGLAPSTIRNAVAPLRVLYREAVQAELVEVSPLVGVQLPASDESDRRHVDDPATVTAMIGALSGQDAAIWATAFYTGLRLGELRALRWRNVDLEAGVLHVTHNYEHTQHELVAPKSRHSVRSVPLSTVVADRLNRQRPADADPDGWVFPGAHGRPFDNGSTTKRANRIWREAKLAEITLHEARHTFASLMIAADANFKVLSELMGHSSITITLDLYGKLMQGAEKTEIEKLTSYMTGA